MVVCVLPVLAFTYWLAGWGAHLSEDPVALMELRVLLDAIKTYRAQTGEFPPDLASVRDRRPDVRLPEASGPRRVEYIPPAGDDAGVVLRSYGHVEPRAGWNLRHDPVVWELDWQGKRRISPVK